MMRHAYMIIAHTEFELLNILCSLIDDERNDIYIHLDKKIPKEEYEKACSDILSRCEKSTIYFTKDRINVTWGGFSQIKAELSLYKEVIASEKSYTYCHLISGCDLPIKTQDEIHRFFEEHDNHEFLSFKEDESFINREIGRVKYYRPFQEKRGRNRKGFWSIIEGGMLLIQKILKVDRTKNNGLTYCYGPNWMSVSMNALRYLVGHEALAYRYFRNTKAGDEFWKQTILRNTEFYDKRFVNSEAAHNRMGEENCMRLVDWNRGGPYTWTIFDKEIIATSSMVFARKFSVIEQEQREIVDFVKEISKNNG